MCLWPIWSPILRIFKFFIKLIAKEKIHLSTKMYGFTWFSYLFNRISHSDQFPRLINVEVFLLWLVYFQKYYSYHLFELLNDKATEWRMLSRWDKCKHDNVCRTLRHSSRRSSIRSTTRRGIASWGVTSGRTWRTRLATSSTSTWAKWPSCCSRAARRGGAPSKFYVVSADAVLPGDGCGACVVCVSVSERVSDLWVSGERAERVVTETVCVRHATRVRTSLYAHCFIFRCWT